MKSLRWWGIVACALCAAMGNARAAEWFVATNGNDSADGTSWTTAKETIQAGVDATADGDTVWVSNGVYETGARIPSGFTLENRVVITNDITVRSVDGPVATVIRGEGPRGTNAVRCVYMTAGELIGFTITNGHTRTDGEGNGDQNGGGLSIFPSASVVVSNCVFSGNSAYNAGGAIFGTFYNCVFSGNSAARAGGGVCSATLHNCVLVENTATEYGGGTDQCTLNNCTIVGNSAPNGGGVYNGTLNNCIAYLNVPANLVFSACRYTRSDPLPSGIGNIAAVPWFLDAAAGNYRLSPDSPCIDAGSNTYVQVETDLDGNPRIVNDTVDMGAYEFLWESPVLMIRPTSLHLPSESASGLSFRVTADVEWTAVTNAPWLSITSGASGTTNGDVVFAVGWNAWPVARTGAVVVSGGGLSSTCKVIQAARDGMATNWYVTTNGNDSAVGTNWATAKLTIQAAIDAAVDGDIVWVDAGTYLGSLDISKGIRLASVDGPLVTTIQANGGRCITLNHFNAVVSGFTITGGRDQNGAGVYMFPPDARVENCIITGNEFKNSSDGDMHVFGGGIYGGSARNCLIVSNVLGAFSPRFGNTTADGAGVAFCALENCTVSDNSALIFGDFSSCAVGGIYNCQTMNTIVWSNLCDYFWQLDGEDPRFAEGSYHLSPDSPYIDAGTNQDWMVDATDLDGNPRIHDGTVDIGAYERTGFWLDPIRTNLEHGASSGNIEVTASVPWTAATNVSWLSITSADSGTTNGTVTFHVEGNGSTASRRGGVIVSGGGFARTCTVIQAGAMTIAPTNLSSSYGATSGTIAVSTWVSWSATSTVPWLAITAGASGIGTGEVVVGISSNPSTRSRTGMVMVAASTDSENPVRVRIVQADNPGWALGYQTLSNGWRELSWFGNYMPQAQEDWIFNPLHGYFYVKPSSTPEDIWLYARDLGWLWTTSAIYPNLYRASDQSWLLYIVGTNPRMFMNQTTGEMEYWQIFSPASNWYVATNGNDYSADGRSWNTAKKTIQAAIDMADAGSTVWVSNGVYATGGRAVNGSVLTNRVVIDKPITVRSVNGPEVTIIQGARDLVTTNGDAAVRCVYLGSNAVLSGFTLTNGATRAMGEEVKGGGAWCEASGVINHCRLLGNVALTGSGVYGGTLNFCNLTGNRADSRFSRGGGAYGATLNDCVLSNNHVAEYGGGAVQSTLNRCRLSQNRVAKRGGGAFDCLLNNCLLDDNSANLGGGGAYMSTLNNCTVLSSSIDTSTINNSIVFNSGWNNSTLYDTYTGDPQFMDAASGNYRLKSISPCVDAGNNEYVQGETDLEGNPRVVAGIVDQGAYELAGYKVWASSITNGQTNDTDCAAGDGVPNLMKYAVGSPNPMAPDDLATLELNRGLVPTLVFHRNPNAADLQWIIEGADVLSNGVVWRGLATNRNGSWGGATNVHESGTGTPVVCTVDDPVPLLTNRFLRLKVTRP